MSLSAKGVGRRAIALSAALILTGMAVATASEPVRSTVVGCVSDGRFVSSDGYVIRPTDAAGLRDLDLSRWEGRRLSLRGDLLPGDVLRLSRSPRVLGRCR